MDEREQLLLEIDALKRENAKLRALAVDTTRAFELKWFAELVEHAPAFVTLLRGESHVFELANQSYRELLGHRTLVGKTVLEAVPEVEGQGFIELLDAVLESGRAYIGHEAPMTVDRGHGPEQRYVTFLYQPVTEPDGRRSGILVIGLDATETAVAHQRLRAQFHGVPAPLYVWQRLPRSDGHQRFVLIDFNEAAVAAAPALVQRRGESAESFFRNEPDVVAELARCLDEGITIKHEVMRSDRKLSLSYSHAPPDVVLMHIDDRTERMELEERLLQAQKMDAVGRLAGGVAHDFNNLLTIILSYVHFRLEPDPDPTELESDLLEIQSAARRAQGLTAQLLAFSRQQVLQPTLLDVNEVVQSLGAMLKRLIGENVALVIDAAATPARSTVDKGQIEQVIVNLVVNARDAMPEGGTVTIHVAPEIVTGDATFASDLTPGEYVVIVVQDTGVGMDEATRARVFEPFFTTKQADKGTGLGLATSFGIVKQSGGHIVVSSEPGRGAEFRVYLPKTDGESTVERRDTRSPPSQSLRGTETILLVEDEDQLRLVTSTILRRYGYRVFDAANAGEAFLIADQHAGEIQLLVTDVVMPRLSGPKLAEALVARFPKLQVLFLSGYTDDEVFRAGVRQDHYGFLQKPFTPNTLLQRVRAVLNR